MTHNKRLIARPAFTALGATLAHRIQLHSFLSEKLLYRLPPLLLPPFYADMPNNNLQKNWMSCKTILIRARKTGLFLRGPLLLYLLGGQLENGFEVTPKYIGNRRIIETAAVATLATDRALLLYGVPGTAKSRVSEHLAAAISSDSTVNYSGTAGTGEEQMRYGWNYASCS